MPLKDTVKVVSNKSTNIETRNVDLPHSFNLYYVNERT